MQRQDIFKLQVINYLILCKYRRILIPGCHKPTFCPASLASYPDAQYTPLHHQSTAFPLASQGDAQRLAPCASEPGAQSLLLWLVLGTKKYAFRFRKIAMKFGFSWDVNSGLLS